MLTHQPASTPLASSSWSPPVIIAPLKTRQSFIRVAREDFLLGGTKQRAITPFLCELRSQGVEEAVYASPFCGFAQVALAVGARASGLKAVIYCERDPHQSEKKAHPFSMLARSYGAVIVLVDNLDEAETQASSYTFQHPSRIKIPLGFHNERYLAHMREAVALQIGIIADQHGGLPKRIWLPVGSGTLARIFIEVVPSQCELLGVNVGILSPTDPRLHHLAKHPQFQQLNCSESFHEKATQIPPIPSNAHYDAKLWRFIYEHGRDGDLWWNVAK